MTRRLMFSTILPGCRGVLRACLFVVGALLLVMPAGGCADGQAARGTFVGTISTTGVYTADNVRRTAYVLHIERGPPWTVQGRTLPGSTGGMRAELLDACTDDIYTARVDLDGQRVRILGVVTTSVSGTVSGRPITASDRSSPAFYLEVKKLVVAHV